MTRAGNAYVAPPSKPTTLDSYIQAAIDATAAAAPSRSRRRRKKHHQQPLTDLPDPFQVKPPEIPPPPPVPTKPKRRKRKSKLTSCVRQSHYISVAHCKFRVRGLVSAEELEDEDEAAELLEEVRDDFSRFGELKELIFVQEDEERSDLLAGDVLVELRDPRDAAKAFTAFDGNVFGGKMVTCAWIEEEKIENAAAMVAVQGIVTPEELEDPDEVEDVKEEVMQVFAKHGVVETMELEEETGDVTVTYSKSRDAQSAVNAINGSRYGGRVVTACLMDLGGEVAGRNESAKSTSVPVKETKRVTACLLQPTESAELQDRVVTFLKRLAALQERAHSLNPKQDRRSRRFVLGLHEVRRGLLNKKVLLLVIATDLDGCEAVAQEIAEIVAIAAGQEVPMLAPMNRRKLGRTLQKKVRVSCVGIYSVDGANDLFRQILRSMAAG